MIGAGGRIHDPHWRVCLLCPLGPYSKGGIKLPDLVGGRYVDVEPAQDVELVVSHRKSTGRIVPMAPGQSSPVKVVAVSVTGL